MEFSSSTPPEGSTLGLPPTQLGRLRHPSQAANHSHNSLLRSPTVASLTSSSTDRLLGLVQSEDEEKRAGTPGSGMNANINANVASRIRIHALHLTIRKFLERMSGVAKLRICCGAVVVLLVVGAYAIRKSGAVKRAVLEGTGSYVLPAFYCLFSFLANKPFFII